MLNPIIHDPYFQKTDVSQARIWFATIHISKNRLWVKQENDLPWLISLKTDYEPSKNLIYHDSYPSWFYLYFTL